MRWILEVVVIISAWLVVCQATHFRGASIQWRHTGDQIKIDYRISWRRSEMHHHCDANKIAHGPQNTEYDMRFINSTDTAYHAGQVIGPMAYDCTDYSVSEDWTTGRGKANFTFKPNGYYEFGFIGCCWISELNVGSEGGWVLRVVADMRTRSDTGKINSSPQVDIPPIVHLQHGCNQQIRLPVSDPDGDIVRCRFSITAEECSDVCDGLPQASIDDSCTISYAAVYKTGWYAVSVQVEDYRRDLSSLKPLSSVPLQFLVYVDTTTCSQRQQEKPKFEPPTLPDGACVGVADGTIFETEIKIISGAGNSISELNTISPLGLVKSPLQKDNNSDTWRIRVTWNPSSADVVTNVFCFTAVDDTGLQSERRCVTLLANVRPPLAIRDSRTPSTSTVQAGQRQWSIQFDQQALHTTRNAYVYLHSAADNRLLEAINVYNASGSSITRGSNGTILHFQTTTDLMPDKTYYFVLGHGLVQGTTYCGAGSMMVTDPYFWRFTAMEKVDVKCYLDGAVIQCDPSSLYYCKENWNIFNPCQHSNLPLIDTKFPHPTESSMFIMCDLTKHMYLGYCPSGEVFHAMCGRCAESGAASTAGCDNVLPSNVANPCTTSALMSGHTLFQYPGSLNKYIHCDVWGHGWEQQCPGGQMWEQTVHSCRTGPLPIGR